VGAVAEQHICRDRAGSAPWFIAAQMLGAVIAGVLLGRLSSLPRPLR
jgi:hypothetical protein